MEYIVIDPIHVNGVQRKRGDVLSGADADAVAGNEFLHHFVVENPHAAVAQSKAAPTVQTAPPAAAPPVTTPPPQRPSTTEEK